MRKRIIIVTALILLALPVFAGGQSEGVYNGEEGRITVYLSGPAEMLNMLEATFEEEHGDVLDFVHMGCGPLRQRVWTETESGSIVADVFWGSDPLLYIAVDERGLLDPYTPAGAEALREECKTDRDYTLVSERYGVVIYNEETVSAVPAGFNDLLDPALEGRIAHADPAQSSTALALVAGLWSVFGNDWEFHQGLGANGLFLTKKNSDVPMKIQEGEFDAGIAPHDAVLRLRKKAKKQGYPTPLRICWPEEGALTIQRPVAISRNEARPEVNQAIAEQFVDFLISKKAQMIMAKFGFISVRRDVPIPEGVPKPLNTVAVDWEYLSLQQNEIRDQFKAIFR